MAILLEWVIAAVIIALFIRYVLMRSLAYFFPPLRKEVGDVRDEYAELAAKLQAEYDRLEVERLRRELNNLKQGETDSNGKS